MISQGYIFISGGIIEIANEEMKSDRDVYKRQVVDFEHSLITFNFYHLFLFLASLKHKV